MADQFYPIYCDECGALIGYMGAHPRGYMICVSCNDKRYTTESPSNEAAK